MKKYEKNPFPWRCSNCREQAVFEAVVDYATQMYHDGHEYTVKVDALKTPRCVKCGQVAPDAEALEFLDGIFVRQLGLLTPEQIRAGRCQSTLTQGELASALGISEAAVVRLEDGGYIQPRSLDNLMRLFFGVPQVRELLTTHQLSSLAHSA
jgi:DNA-binding XRE family transcriptional regulator